jgi:hypothetical protein
MPRGHFKQPETVPSVAGSPKTAMNHVWISAFRRSRGPRKRGTPNNSLLARSGHPPISNTNDRLAGVRQPQQTQQRDGDHLAEDGETKEQKRHASANNGCFNQIQDTHTNTQLTARDHLRFLPTQNGRTASLRADVIFYTFFRLAQAGIGGFSQSLKRKNEIETGSFRFILRGVTNTKSHRQGQSTPKCRRKMEKEARISAIRESAESFLQLT